MELLSVNENSPLHNGEKAVLVRQMDGSEAAAAAVAVVVRNINDTHSAESSHSVGLDDLPAEVIHELSGWMLDDHCPALGALPTVDGYASAIALTHLLSTCTALRNEAPAVSKVAAKHAVERWRCFSVATIEQYAVLSAIMAGGGSCLTFKDARCELREGGGSRARIDLIARLLQRHPFLHVRVEAHAGLAAPDTFADGFACNRARHVGVLLVARGVEPARVGMRGWGKSVTRLAHWGAGLASRRADAFLTFTDYRGAIHHLPPRPAYYNGSQALPTSVRVDRHFFDAVAQEMMQDIDVQAAFESMHSQRWAELCIATPTLRDKLEAIHQNVGTAASRTRDLPSVEELRVTQYVIGRAASASSSA